VVINAAAQVGDLAESALKRSAGVKDSGSILPPWRRPGPYRRPAAGAPALWYVQVIHQWF